VKIWEEKIVIPTYEINPPDLNPEFYIGRTYQGAQGRIYPYPMIDNLTDKKIDKSYNAVYLENDYIKLNILPEIGGRIYSALDKTNNYDFIYRQSVIKPSLIGMLGAWISGGIEWNILHHHRASTFMPMDYILQENNDGSKTVWIGELERRHRIKWIVGVTVFPQKSYFKVTIKIFNQTPFVNSLLCWANTAVHTNEQYQVIFPPHTQFATQHSKVEFTEWPISYSRYARTDYTDGVDISWWKNHTNSVSFFAWNYKDDFVAGYDHGKNAGICSYSDHFIAPGKKFFEFGNGPSGRMWDKILTDTDGPYLEIMTGAYSDNQPDYSWCQPYEVKLVDLYWYPIREIKSVKEANLNAAVNLDITDKNTAFIGFNTTSEFKNAKVILENKSNILFEKYIDISPDKPFTYEVKLLDNIEKKNLKASLFSSNGELLISYQPVELKKEEKPKSVRPPKEPKDIETVEELYLTGLRLEQFHNPRVEPYQYYEEGLKRDPYDYRCNTALGVLYLKRNMFEKAEEHLKRAIERATKDYTMPKDGEAFYYLGIALKAQEKYDEAEKFLQKATWSFAWFPQAYYEIAEIKCYQNEYQRALELLEKSLSRNATNTKALNLKTTILRHIKMYDEAEKIPPIVLNIDPLDVWAEYEEFLLKDNKTKEKNESINVLKRGLNGDYVQTYLELAVDFGNCGFWDDGIDILKRLIEYKKDKIYPLIYYYLGYFNEKKGEQNEALKYYQLGSKMSTDYCFPFRFETIKVLNSAINKNPNDARAHYYLGNLLYDSQPENAILEWEKSRSIDNLLGILHRNLGFAYIHFENNLQKAIESMEKAIEYNPNDPRYYLEIDQMYERAGTSPEKRLALLQKNHKTVIQRADALSREITLLVQMGYYDNAIELMKDYRFHIWEGSGGIHDTYVDTYLLRGQNKLKLKKYEDALQDFKKALEYPENFQVGKPNRDEGELKINYLIASAFELLKNKSNADEYFKKTVSFEADPGDVLYYQGLAYEKLNNKLKADSIYDMLIEYGNNIIKDNIKADVFAKFGERGSRNARDANAHYLIGLGYLGKQKKKEAKSEFEKALQLNENHLYAKIQLNNL
jgi:tetratricopeptide (TPR) repeat protein